ncbi:MAG: glycoside hydrolase family 3 C-terminal domain-containing protein [Clostridia bacterium]|nr:glycoside hydrolase family 3 C-terminal domain-containing protein [Clostridia bacterium]
MELVNKIKTKTGRLISAAFNAVAQTGSTPPVAGSAPTDEIKALARQAGAEGIVLLRNEKETLPLKRDAVVSVFGRVQTDFFFVGYGSGGDVNVPYKINLLDGLRANEHIQVNETLAAVYEAWTTANPVDDGYWGHWPLCYDEMPVSDKLVREARAQGDTALVVIGRSAGEDRDSLLKPGSYYLTKEERTLLERVTARFPKVAVLLNCGSIMDMGWLADFGERITAVLYVWQNGMESGNSIADVLSGAVSPCGKLADTIADRYESYPCARYFGDRDVNVYAEDIYVGYRFFETFARSHVLFPFGFGLSYTDFSLTVTRTRVSGDSVSLWVEVKNTGDRFAGKQVVQAYLKAPQGLLGRPLRSLVAFEKTDVLAPGESQKLRLDFSLSDCAAFDDSGCTGHRNAYVLEKGAYEIFVGADVRAAQRVRVIHVPALRVVRQCEAICTPNPDHPFERLVPVADNTGVLRPMTRRAPAGGADLRRRILDRRPLDIPQTGDLGFTLDDVRTGRVSLNGFIAQLDFDELEAITRGDYTMGSPLGAAGNAGAIGGVLPALRAKGIPAVTTTDGPSGIRLSETCSLLPNGVALACTFNQDLVEALFAALSEEMTRKGSDILLAPGMNIHRSPLCGRNFEYFSEDPLLTGKIAAAYVRGVQTCGHSACPKHFACNNQETNRTHNDSRVSQRALREIYLRGFEICVKEAKPKNLMTSYNKINGVWAHYNYDLCQTVLRGEWGYAGCVITDWWMRSDESHEFAGVHDQGYRIRARVDVLMPGGPRTGKRTPDGTLKQSMAAKDGVTFGEMQRCAKDVLTMILALKPTPGKPLCVQTKFGAFARKPIRTHVIQKDDALCELMDRYVVGKVNPDDYLFISEKVVAITQGRAFDIGDIRPSSLAKLLSRCVHKSQYGIGLGSPWTMELALRDVGVPRMLLAAVSAAVTKPFGIRGVFYRVAGEKARAIDGPCDCTIPPYNHYAKLSPADPDKVAAELAAQIGCRTVVIDANDFGVEVLGRSDKSIPVDFCKAVFLDNPLGQSAQSTPLAVVSKGAAAPALC